jgi:hypothetical protein
MFPLQRIDAATNELFEAVISLQFAPNCKRQFVREFNDAVVSEFRI